MTDYHCDDIKVLNLNGSGIYYGRKNDIDKAQGHTLYKLSVALGCEVEDLLEMPMK